MTEAAMRSCNDSNGANDRTEVKDVIDENSCASEPTTQTGPGPSTSNPTEGGVDAYGRSLLSRAIVSYNIELFRVVLAATHDEAVDDTCDLGRSALWYASRSGQPEAVQALLERHADALLEDCDGISPVAVAVLNSHDEVAAVLLKTLSFDALADLIGGMAHSSHLELLSLACRLRDNDKELVVNLMNSLPADVCPNHKNCQGFFPLEIAPPGSLQQLTLIRFGARLHCVRDQWALIQAFTKPGNTELHQRIWHHYQPNENDTRQIFAQTSVVNSQDDHLRRTALHHALARNEAPWAQLVLKAGANAFLSDVFGRTPIHEGVRAGSLEAVRSVLAYVEVTSGLNATTQLVNMEDIFKRRAIDYIHTLDVHHHEGIQCGNCRLRGVVGPKYYVCDCCSDESEMLSAYCFSCWRELPVRYRAWNWFALQTRDTVSSVNALRAQQTRFGHVFREVSIDEQAMDDRMELLWLLLSKGSKRPTSSPNVVIAMVALLSAVALPFSLLRALSRGMSATNLEFCWANIQRKDLDFGSVKAALVRECIGSLLAVATIAAVISSLYYFVPARYVPIILLACTGAVLLVLSGGRNQLQPKHHTRQESKKRHQSVAARTRASTTLAEGQFADHAQSTGVADGGLGVGLASTLPQVSTEIVPSSPTVDSPTPDVEAPTTTANEGGEHMTQSLLDAGPSNRSDCPAARQSRAEWEGSAGSRRRRFGIRNAFLGITFLIEASQWFGVVFSPAFYWEHYSGKMLRVTRWLALEECDVLVWMICAIWLGAASYACATSFVHGFQPVVDKLGAHRPPVTWYSQNVAWQTLVVFLVQGFAFPVMKLAPVESATSVAVSTTSAYCAIAFVITSACTLPSIVRWQEWSRHDFYYAHFLGTTYMIPKIAIVILDHLANTTDPTAAIAVGVIVDVTFLAALGRKSRKLQSDCSELQQPKMRTIVFKACLWMSFTARLAVLVSVWLGQSGDHYCTVILLVAWVLVIGSFWDKARRSRNSGI